MNRQLVRMVVPRLRSNLDEIHSSFRRGCHPTMHDRKTPGHIRCLRRSSGAGLVGQIWGDAKLLGAPVA